MRRAFGQYPAGRLADILAFKSLLQGFVMKLVGKAVVGEKGHKGSDVIGTLHVAHFVPFENNHLGFFTIFDGDFAKYIQDFADKNSFIFDTLFPHVVGTPPTPVAKNAQAFYQWALDNNYPPIGFYSAYPGLSVQTFEPCWPIASHNRPPLDSRCGTTNNQELRVGKAEQNTRRNTMSQSHLVIDFPIKGPANAKALPEVLPPLMPDLATAQDRLGTVHFSRFMVKGDEKLLFLSDIDGEVDQHIERLVESAGPVFDAIFTHVDDPPATPVAGNPQGVVKWLKRHVREPLDTYFAYEDASVQDIKAAARAAGVTGKTSQAPLLTYMAFESRVQGFVLKLVGKALVGKRRQAKRQMRSERCISPIGCPLRTTTSASSQSTTVILGQYMQDFATKTSFVWDALFPHIEGAPPPQSQRTSRRSVSGHWKNNYPPIGFYSAYPGLSVQDIRALMADRKSHPATTR